MGNKLKKIIRITTSLKAGAGETVKNINNSVNESPYFISKIIAPREDKTNSNVINHNFNKLDFAWNYFRTKFLGLDSIYSPKWMKFLKSICDDYDIFHLHHLQGYFFDIRSLRFLENSKVVLTLHDYWPLTGGCSYPKDCDSWQEGCKNCKNSKSYPETFIDLSPYLFKKKKKLFTQLNNLTVVALSNYSASVVKKSYLSDRDIYVIPNGVNMEIFKPLGQNQKKNDSGKRVRVGVISNHLDSRRKGLSLLREIIRKFDFKKFKLVVAGKVNNKELTELLKNPNIDFKGFINNKRKLNEFYNEIDVLLNLSKAETFGKTTVESQASGTPVLTRKEPVFSETNLFGAFFEEESIGEISSKIEDLVSSEFDQNEMHNKISELFSIERMKRDYIELYHTT